MFFFLMAVLGLKSVLLRLSLVAVRRGYSLVRAQVSHMVASLVEEQGL